MPTIPIPRFNDLDPNDPEDLVTRLTRLSRTLEYLTGHLDHDNVRRLHTEEAIIQSRYGETIINGPTLKMYSSGAAVEGSTSTGTLRLKMGYESTSSNFVFNMYSQDGSEAVSLNSTGHLKLAGKPLIEMYGDSTTKRLQMGHTTAAGEDFVFKIWNVAGSTMIELDSSGNVVFLGTLRSGSTTGARIEIAANAMVSYSSDNQKNGMALGQGYGLYYGDVSFYDADDETLRIENQLAGAGWNVYSPSTSASLSIGRAGRALFLRGNLGFFEAVSASGKVSVANLSTAATLGETIDKVNELLDALQGYNLV